MKRDDEFIRETMLALETSDDTCLIIGEGLNPDDEMEKLIYHVQLLADAGFMTKMGSGVYRMTNDGHDFVEAIRSDTVWNKTKAGARAAGGMTLTMIKDLALGYIKLELTERTGIPL